MWRLFSAIETLSLEQLLVEVAKKNIIELIATLSFRKLILKDMKLKEQVYVYAS